MAAALAALLLPLGHAGAAPSTAPLVGQCHDYGYYAAIKEHDKSDPVSCDARHTARVIAVHDLPSGKSWSDYNLEQLSHLAGKYCFPALWHALGRTHKVRDQTAYTYFWFTPTKAQRHDGARWIRCDIGLQGGTKLVPLPTDRQPALPSGSLGKKIKRCYTGKGHLTTCNRPHHFKAMGAFVMKVKHYPSDAEKKRLAVHHCGRFVTSRYFSWSTQGHYAFRLGDHVMVCYNQS